MAILIKNCAVLDAEAKMGFRENINIVVEGTNISHVGPEMPAGSFEKVIEGRDYLAIPGLVNGHTHSAETYLKGTSDRLPLEVWLVHLDGTCGVYQPRDVYLTCMLGAIEMIKTGVTSLLDHLWISPGLSVEGLDAAMQAYSDVGIRAAAAPMFDDDDLVVKYAMKRGYPLDDTFFAQRFDVRPKLDEHVEILSSFFDRWHQKEEGRLSCLAGPSGIQWCSAEFMSFYSELARKQGGMVHTHCLESETQANVCNEMLGKTGIEHLRDCGALGSDVSLAHCVWLTDRDIQILAETGTMVVHNPAANLKLGSGIAPVRKMLDAGVKVGIGTDGSASSDNQVLFDMLKLTAMIHCLTSEKPEKWVGASEIVEMATAHGGHIMGCGEKLGQIKPGCLADIALLDLNTPHMVPLNNAHNSLVYCETGASVDTVIINGRIVMEERTLTMVDEMSILKEIKENVKSRRNGCNYLSEDEVNKAIDQFARFMEECVYAEK